MLSKVKTEKFSTDDAQKILDALFTAKRQNFSFRESKKLEDLICPNKGKRPYIRPQCEYFKMRHIRSGIHSAASLQESEIACRIFYRWFSRKSWQNVSWNMTAYFNGQICHYDQRDLMIIAKNTARIIALRRAGKSTKHLRRRYARLSS